MAQSLPMIIGGAFTAGAVALGGVVYWQASLAKDPVEGATEGPQISVTASAEDAIEVVAPSEETVVATAPVEEAIEETASGEDAPNVPEPAPEAVAEAAETVVSNPVAEEASAPEAVDVEEAPSLDVVRIEADGAAVLAGRAPVGGPVTLRVDGKEVGQADPDADGNFVALLDLPSSDTPQVLTVEADKGDGAATLGEESIIIAPVVADVEIAPIPPKDAIVETAAADAPVAEVPTPSVGASTAPAVAEVVAPTTPTTIATNPPSVSIEAETTVLASPAAEAPRLFRAGRSGIRVETSADTRPSATETLGLDAIAYDTDGDVQLTGRGNADTSLRVYLDGRPVQTIDIGTGGVWASPLPDVDEGVYTLRIDAIDREGAVVSRLETPFERTAPEIAAAARASGNTAITVQPGFTLWAISEGYFGDGAAFVQIFQANADLIRDPDLIYPGQVFTLPDASGTASDTN